MSEGPRVDAEERLVGRQPHFLEKLRGGPLLNGDDHVVEVLPDLRRDAPDRPLDGPVELPGAEFSMALTARRPRPSPRGRPPAS